MPSRVGAFWPGRLWQPPAGTTAAWPEGSLATLAEDPPAVWWGWDEPGGRHDQIRWRGLDRRVRRLLATLPTLAR